MTRQSKRLAITVNRMVKYVIPCSGKFSENVDKFTRLIELLSQCDCTCDGSGGGNEGGDGDGDEGGLVGEEQLLDIDMTSGLNIDEFVPFDSNSYGRDHNNGGTYQPWKAFQKTSSTDRFDCWASGERPTQTAPEFLSLVMMQNRYIVTKVEFDTRNRIGSPMVGR